MARRHSLLPHRRRRPCSLARAQSLVFRRSALLLSRPLVGARHSGQRELTRAAATGALAAQYFFAAGQLVAGLPALLLGAVGIARRSDSPRSLAVLLLALPPLFYVWSIHSVRHADLRPDALAEHLLQHSLCPGALAADRPRVPPRLRTACRTLGAFVLIVLALSPFLIHPAEHPVTWQEADVNSRARRQWTSEAANFLRTTAGPNETFFTSFGDLTAIYRTLGIPLRDTLTGDNEVAWVRSRSPPRSFSPHRLGCCDGRR